MTSREELIKEALHAYHDVEDRGQSWEWSQESLDGMFSAFAVFERGCLMVEDDIPMEILRIANEVWPKGGDEFSAFLNGSSVTLDLIEEARND